MRCSEYAALCLALCILFLLCAPAAGGPSIKLRVTAEQANIRQGPDISSTVLSQVAEGTVLEAERKEGEWFAVWVEKEEGGFLLGYVHESLVMVIEAPEKKEREEPVVEEPAREKLEEKKPPPPPAPPLLTEPEKKRYILALWFGGRYAPVGDLNEGAEGMVPYFKSLLGAEGTGKIEALHWGYVIGLNFQVPLSSGFFVSYGVEYFSAKKPSSVEFNESSPAGLYFTRPELTVVPLSLSLVYHPLSVISIKAGLDFNWARCVYFYRFEQGDSWQLWRGAASAGSLGFHIGLGMDWAAHPNVALTAEVIYRQGKVKELEGEGSFQSSTGVDSLEQGDLYFFRFKTARKGYVPQVFIREQDPSGEPDVIDARHAALDLSGISLRLGIKFKF